MWIPILTLWRPWANWVALGWKPIETRTHDKFRSLVGKRIGIHAGAKWDRFAIDEARAWLTREQYLQTNEFLNVGSAIISVATVVEHRKLTAEDSKGALIDCDPTNMQRFGLILQNVTTIDAIPIKGKQGIWYAEVPDVNPVVR